jgi:predicted transcriptional regulator
MTNGFASLHKVLKDETRRRIVLLLNEKGSLSFTDLMNTLEIDNTGRMNYHLKVLDDLIAKRENGKYALTEKGKLSSQLLLELPENTGQLYKRWIMATLKAKEPNYLLGE